MTSKKSGGKFVNIAVVGLCGYDSPTNSLYGVGKSCLCNRFTKDTHDDYSPNHSSIFSTSDFVGSVLNNDHFLYWGTVEKHFTDAVAPVSFRIIEQTEFIDDASYVPLSKDSQLTPYVKRASVAKVQSPGKIMYINRDQVALESEFKSVQMDAYGNGKLQLDGFVCVYDVSTSFAKKTNYTEIQENVLSSLLTNISKTKKPVVVVATKCDETDEKLLNRAHQFVVARKIAAPLVESSSENFINVDVAFQVLNHLIESKTTRSGFGRKTPTYSEGLTLREQAVKKSKEEYLSLIKTASDVTSALLMSWAEFRKKHSSDEPYRRYIKLCGVESASNIFKRQEKKIRQHFEDKKMNEYMNKLPDALDDLLPTISSIKANGMNWDTCQLTIHNHINFDKWFVILAEGEAWNTPERLFHPEETRIPINVLQSVRARKSFDHHIMKLHESARKGQLKNEFRKLLEGTTEICPGTSWADASVLIESSPQYLALDETVRKVLYETYLRDITFKAKLAFQELLFESASRFSRLSRDSRPSELEMQNLYEFLQDDTRYKYLENFGNSIDILLFNHIALMQSPTRCLSGPENCMDRHMQQVVERTTRRTTANPYENDMFRDDEQINILIIGEATLGTQLEDTIKVESSSFDCVEYIVDGDICSLNLKVYNNEDDLTQVAEQFKPQAYLAIFSTAESLHYVEECLKKLHDGVHDTGLPSIIILANEGGLNDQQITAIRTDANNLANSLDCVFLDYPYTVSLMDDTIHDSQVQDALRRIVDVINKRQISPYSPGSVGDKADVRILLCSMCGDEYPVELILGPMMQRHTCYSSPDQQDTIMIEAVIAGGKRTIAVTLVSFHRAYSLKSQLYHGFILIYSAARLASLETLRAFASSLPKVPIQVLAVTGSSSGASVIFHDEQLLDASSSALLVHDTTKLSAKLSTQFSFQKQAGAFVNFFNNTFERRKETELTLQGIKRRRQGPLPDVPKARTDKVSVMVDDDEDNGIYASISQIPQPPDSPYVEVAVRHSYINPVDDSSPDSVHRQLTDGRLADRLSGVESLDEDYVHVDHDDTGLYALVNKKCSVNNPSTAVVSPRQPPTSPRQTSYSYIKSVEDFSEDDDDDVVWQDNSAYGVIVTPPQRTQSLSEKRDSPYATVPYLPKGQDMVREFNDKHFATMPTKKTEWSNDSEYASIDQVVSESMGRKKLFEDTASSVSSRSNEERPWQTHAKETPPATRKQAPLAKQDEEEENNDIRDLRKNLEVSLNQHKTPSPTTTDEVARRGSVDSILNPSNRKHRTESNLSAGSEHGKGGLFKKLKHKITPNPSPINSDTETDPLSDSTPVKKRGKGKSFRNKRNQTNSTADELETTDNDEVRNRSVTLPMTNDTGTVPNNNATGGVKGQRNNKPNKAVGKLKKNTSETTLSPGLSPDPHSTIEKSQTLDRKRSKRWIKSNKETKDDLDIPSTEKASEEKPKKPKTKISVRMPLSKARRGNKQQDLKDEWLKKQKPKPGLYFGRPLKDVCRADTNCPQFVHSVIEFIENTGLEMEGLYRLSGNKMDVEAVQTKFEQNNSVVLQELGVGVHAVTGALKNFFKMLPEPLVPYSTSSQTHDIMNNMDADVRMDKLRELVRNIQQPNQQVFKLFMHHLHKVSQYKRTNKMDVRNLQIIVYPTLVRPVFESLQNMAQDMNMGLFIHTCIEHYSRIFDDDVMDDDATNDVTNNDGELSFSEQIMQDAHVANHLTDTSHPNNDVTSGDVTIPMVTLTIATPAVSPRSDEVVVTSCEEDGPPTTIMSETKKTKSPQSTFYVESCVASSFVVTIPAETSVVVTKNSCENVSKSNENVTEPGNNDDVANGVSAAADDVFVAKHSDSIKPSSSKSDTAKIDVSKTKKMEPITIRTLKREPGTPSPFRNRAKNRQSIETAID